MNEQEYIDRIKSIREEKEQLFTHEIRATRTYYRLCMEIFCSSDAESELKENLEDFDKIYSKAIQCVNNKEYSQAQRFIVKLEASCEKLKKQMNLIDWFMEE